MEGPPYWRSNGSVAEVRGEHDRAGSQLSWQGLRPVTRHTLVLPVEAAQQQQQQQAKTYNCCVLFSGDGFSVRPKIAMSFLSRSRNRKTKCRFSRLKSVLFTGSR